MKKKFGKYAILNTLDNLVIEVKGRGLTIPTEEERALNNVKNEDDVTIFLQDYARRLSQRQEHIKFLIEL